MSVIHDDNWCLLETKCVSLSRLKGKLFHWPISAPQGDTIVVFKWTFSLLSRAKFDFLKSRMWNFRRLPFYIPFHWLATMLDLVTCLRIRYPWHLRYSKRRYSEYTRNFNQFDARMLWNVFVILKVSRGNFSGWLWWKWAK